MALAFKRKAGEGFWIGEAFVEVARIQASLNQVAIRVTAPRHIRVMRAEIDGRQTPETEREALVRHALDAGTIKETRDTLDAMENQ